MIGLILARSIRSLVVGSLIETSSFKIAPSATFLLGVSECAVYANYYDKRLSQLCQQACSIA
jgi:hypothetical protein